MFNKVLIVDDHDDINKSVLTILNTYGITTVETAQYCDDAYLKVKKAVLINAPFDLLITDLSFKKDHRECTICTGEQLALTVKANHPEVSVIVYSMDTRLQRVRNLMNNNVGAYVCKDRKGSQELAQAIKEVYNKKQFLSPQVKNALSPKSNLEINDTDIEIIKQLSYGLSQKEISSYLKHHNYSPSSLSAVEKQLTKLKDMFKANNSIHLVALVKDLGLI